MSKISRISLVERTAAHLREGVFTRRWTERLPGIRPLSVELGVSQHTLRAAFEILADEGLVSGGNAGETYRIAARPGVKKAGDFRSLNIAILIRGGFADLPSGSQAYLLGIMNDMREHGHRAFCIPSPKGRSSRETGRLKTLVAGTEADAWVVPTGSREVLSWFADSGIPTLALGGRNHGLDIATANITMHEPSREIVRRLVRLGHTRIVLIIADFSRKPTDSPVTRAFREELAAAGIKAGDYHIPDWEETPRGLTALLDSLFAVTPPTAIYCWPSEAVVATLAYLSRRGLRIPEDISFACGGDSSLYEWLSPDLKVAHVRATAGRQLRRVREWTKSIAEGRADKRHSDIPSRAVEGNSLGPPKR